MTLDWIATPISEDAPSGPDLWSDDDPEFSDYYFTAMERLPEADDYAKIGLSMGAGNKAPDTIFDPKSVDIEAETRTIDTLLKRTRDVRLLTLRTQWGMLAGRSDVALESLNAMADLLEAQIETAHPDLSGGPADRLEAINDLAQLGSVILPLRYLDIAGTGTSLRRMRVARGEFTPHDGEDDIMIETLVQALRREEEGVADAHEELTAMKEALARIETACLTSDTPHTPRLGALKQELDGVLAMIGEAQPELLAEEATVDGDESDGSDAPQLTGGITTHVRPATEVTDHEDARRRLAAVETYFGRHEPSSATVLMVTQARLLIGKSLIDAFDTLMPDTAPRAKVAFIEDNGFQLSHAQLRQLADQVEVEEATPEPDPMPAPSPEPIAEPVVELETENVDDGEEGSPIEEAPQVEAVAADPPPPTTPSPDMPKTYRVTNASEAGVQIMAVETYFRAVEKSSPIPMLLARARSYIGKDFEALLKEIVPRLEY